MTSHDRCSMPERVLVRARRLAGLSRFMKKFSFKLDTVRRLREQEEQLVRIELAASMRDRAAVAQRLEDSRHAQHELYEYMRTGQLSAADMGHMARYDELHRQKIVDAIVELKYADDAANRIRARLVDAQARREALDRLRDRHREAHRKEALAEEARELDEIGTIRRGQRATMAIEVAA